MSSSAESSELPELVQRELERSWRGVRRRATQFAIDHVPPWLAALGLPSLLAGVAAFVNYPPLAGITCAVVALVAIAGLYLMRREQRGWARRYARSQLANHDLRLQLERKELQLDQAVLAITGEPRDRQVRHHMQHPELHAALRVSDSRLTAARLTSVPQSERARRRGGQAVVKGPNVASIRRRIDARKQMIAALKATQDELRRPSDPAAAVLARETRKQAREAMSAAREADRAERPLTPAARVRAQNAAAAASSRAS